MITFAWVDPEDTAFDPAFAREDEDVFALRISHSEGDFAYAHVDVRNPRVGFLGAGRKQWAWIAHDDGTTDGVTPLFFGRLVGIPQDSFAEEVRLEFVARPANYVALKAALAESLKVTPYYDPMWIAPDRRSDPDTVMEGYPAFWHIDRTSHAVTISDVITGEDGVIEIAGDFFRDSLGITYGPAPIRTVKVEAEVFWTQLAAGEVDITAELVSAFHAKGSTKPYLISSLTGEGLMADWPEEGDRIGGGWTFGPTSIVRADSRVAETDWYATTGIGGIRALYPIWEMRPHMEVRYDASRQFNETVTFSLEADVQAVIADPGDEDVLYLSLSGKADEPADPPDTENPEGTLPLSDTRLRSYFNSARGRQSLETLIAMARARILARSRAVEIRFQTTFENGFGMSCRKNVTLEDARLPGGTATGKIVGYELYINGDTGENWTDALIGCAVGNGTSVSTVAGSPTYVETGYVDAGWQAYAGATIMPIAGEVTYEDFSTVPPNDDGLDFLALRAVDVIQEIYISHGETDHKEALDAFGGSWGLPKDVNERLNELHTRVCLTLKPLNNGPFETIYDVTTSALSVPKTIDLEAA